MADIDVYKEWLGIPEGVRPPDFYTILRLVQFEDDIEKVQSNYRKLNAHVRKYATGQYLKQSQDLLNEMAKAMLCLTDPNAKREYDESQGREVTTTDGDGASTMLDHLVEQGVINRTQASEIDHFAEARGLTPRDAVIQMNLADHTQAAKALAAELRVPFVDLDDMLPEDDALDRLPRNVVKRHTCLPLFEDRGKMMVACVDHPTPELEDEIRLRYGMSMRTVLAVPRSIQQGIAKYYAKGMRDDSVADTASATSTKPGKSNGNPKPKAAKVAAGPVSVDEKAKRKQLSLIIICWSLIVPIWVINITGVMGWFGMFATGFGVAAVVAGILKMTYWK